MDKQKKQFDFNELWRHRFWIACGLISVACLVTFVISIRSVEAERSDRESTIQQSSRSIQNVLSTTVEDIEEVAVHPNENTERGMQEKIEAAAAANLEAWRMRYEAQQEHLRWPEVIPERLRQTLISQKQPETIEQTGWRLSSAQRDTFRENIVKVMPGLTEKIGAIWKHGGQVEAATSAPRQAAAVGTDVAKDTAIVRWNEDNQDIWHSKVTEFRGRNGNPDDFPTELQIFAVQQDLWVLGAVFDIIRKVNGDVAANDLAKIKRVDHILIGAMAGSWEEIGSVFAGQAVTSDSNQRSNGAGRAFDPAESNSPFHGRYINREFERIGKTKLLEALTSDTLIEDSYLQVARRIPVRVAVRMDERRIEEFLAACANSPFIFEIHRVRINEHEPNEGFRPEEGTLGRQRGRRDGGDGADVAGREGGDDRAAMIGGAGGGRRGEGDRRGRGPGDVGQEILTTAQRTNFDVDVEFYGVIRLYNEVREDLLFGRQPQQTAGDGSADDTVSGTAPSPPRG